MTLRKQNIDYPDTLRGINKNTDKYKITESLFFTPVDFAFTEDEWIDNDYWYSQLGINIFPLHHITDFQPTDIQETYTESKQDFKYKSFKGRYSQNVKYDWSLDYHKTINEVSGQDVRVIYISGRVIRGTLTDDGVQGFKVSIFDLKKLAFTIGASQGNSELFIELFDPDELNVNGYEVEVNWQPKKLDRLILSIDLNFTETTIVLSATYNGVGVEGIQNTDITITDDVNGNIEFSTFVPGSGIYTLGDFSNTITSACMYIQSTLYIGAKRFLYTVVITVEDLMIWADADDATWQDVTDFISFAKN